jgi:hypothetical protein
MGSLYDILPAGARKPLYAAYGFLGLGLGATQVAYSAADAGQPVWLTVSLAVFAFVGTGFGFTAAANVGTAPSDGGFSLGDRGEFE